LASSGITVRPRGGERPAGVAEFSFRLYAIPFRMRCELDGDRVTGPTELWCAETREATRIALEEPIEIEWVSVEEDGVVYHRAPLLDLGTNGARSLHVSGSQRLPQQPFAATIVYRDRAVPCMAEVRTERTGARGVEYGLRIVTRNAEPIADIVIATQFPRVTLRRNVSAAQLDTLFKQSGYVELRDSCTSSNSWATLDADGITRDLVYIAEDGTAIAHSSITRAYTRAWIGHQTAMILDHPEAASARSLLTALEMTTSLLDGPGALLVAYYDPSISYGRVFFEQFVRDARDPNLAVIAPLDWIERESAVPLGDLPGLALNVEVSAASDRELLWVTALARKNLPQLMADAMDLHPAMLRSAALHPAYAVDTELERSREVLVVRLDGHIVGAAICELTSRHLSLFNTFNLAQLFFASGASRAAQRMLYHHTLRLYADRGISDPFVVAPPDSFDVTVDPHTHLKMRIGCITWSFEGIRVYENYLRMRCGLLKRRPRPRSGERRGAA
jgi:hypothetical protein